MINRPLTRGLTALLLTLMILICACGSSEDAAQKDEHSDKEIDSYEFIDLGINLANDSEYSNIGFDKNGIYSLKRTKSEGHINYSFVRLRNEDKKQEEVLLGSGNTNLDYLITGDDECFYAIRTIYPDNLAFQNFPGEDSYVGHGEKRLVKYSSSGDEIWAVALTESDENFYIVDMAYLEDRGIITYSQNGVFSLYDKDTGRGSILQFKDEGNPHGDRMFFTSSDGKLFIGETDNKWKYVLYEIDKKRLKLGKRQYAPAEINNGYNLFPGKTNDFYYVNNNIVYAFNMGDSSLTKICNFEDAGFYADSTLILYEYSDYTFRLMTNYKIGTAKTYDMTRIDSESAEKKVITIGTAFTDEYVKKRIVEFNQNSDKYVIKVKDYSEDGYASYYSLYKAINKDIEEGNAPDIMVLNSYASIDSYISEGLLEPLDKYIENDLEIQGKNYLSNISSLLKRNGKQYMVMPFFSVSTCAASKSLLEGENVTLNNYINLCNKHNIKVQNLMGNKTFDSAEDMYTASGFDFIDFEYNTCDFKNYKFINLLIYIRELKRLQEKNSLSDDENIFRDKKALLQSCYISSFEDYRIIKDGYFSADVVFNGYPGKEGGLSYIDPGMLFAISSFSTNKDAAWEFIRYFLLDEYQFNVDWGFPVNEDAFNALMEKSQKEKYYISDEGQKINTYSKVIIGDREITITPLNENEAVELKTLICSIDKLRHQDSEIIGIINEVAKSYYIGDITAEKASSMIQHRVEKYLSTE
ncbi:ABC transporter substrate-binding protein [Butyrivibrio sp. JL13D10]|uniref:ABC transporter substrate-binding protein n=1 Tax=Butyrivibrio sp. JL13D10 TaxID=3236815 RepID=UPI0038B5CCF2